MTWQEKSDIVSRLQRASSEVFDSVISELRIGLSEVAIADKVQTKLSQRGITDYWYDVPIFVLLGAERFQTMDSKDYGLKSPSEKSVLYEGCPVYIDIHAMDSQTLLWGDWNSMVVFRPRPGTDDDEVSFLDEMRHIQRAIIAQLTAQKTGAEISQICADAFSQENITLLDVRNTIGHSMHAGLKADADRIWLDKFNDVPLGEGIFTVEPGGIKPGRHGETLVARFEDSVYLPKTGKAVILGTA